MCPRYVRFEFLRDKRTPKSNLEGRANRGLASELANGANRAKIYRGIKVTRCCPITPAPILCKELQMRTRRLPVIELTTNREVCDNGVG